MLIKNLIQILENDVFTITEEKKKTDTKTKNADLSWLNKMDAEPNIEKFKGQDKAKDKEDTKRKSKSTGSTKIDSVSGEEAAKRLKNVKMSDKAADMLSKLQQDQDEISDEEALRISGRTRSRHSGKPELKTNVKNALTVSKRDLTTTGTKLTTTGKELDVGSKVHPAFLEVKHLPGYLGSAIRSLGRQVFAPFTRTPIEDIKVIATLGGGGPNTKRELNAVLNHVEIHGVAQPTMEFQMEKKLPGYSGKMKIYEEGGNVYLVVVDEFGEYIYTWPAKDSKLAIEQED